MSSGDVHEQHTVAAFERSKYESDPRNRSIADALRLVAEKPVNPLSRAGVILLDSKGNEDRLHYADLWMAARITANGLRRRGVKQGDRLILLLPTSSEYVVVVCAAIILGALPCTIATPTMRARVDDTLRYLIPVRDKLQPTLIVTTEAIRSIIATHPGFDPESIVIPNDLQKNGQVPPDSLPGVRGSDPMHIQLTSGSTNKPKGVVLSHDSVIANIQAIASAVDLVPDVDTGLSWLPLYHDMGFIQLMMAIYYQTTIVLMTPSSFIRNPLGWLHTIEQYRASLTAAPTFAYTLCVRKFDQERSHTLDLSSWRRAFVGAETVPFRVIEDFRRTFQPYGLSEHTLYPCYGMAETVLATTLPIAGQFPNRRFGFVSVDVIDAGHLRHERYAKPDVCHDLSVDTIEIIGTGHVAQGLDLCIQDTDGQKLLDRHVGEICVRGTSLMTEYYNDPEATTTALSGDWFHTGDLGYLVDGELYVLGRIKELLIVHGRNYQPDDVEEVIERHEGVRKGYTVAFAVGNIERGTDDVVAIVETRASPEEQAAMHKQIQQSLQRAFGFLADTLIFVPHSTLPRTTSGKRQRVLAQTWYRDGKFDS